MGRLAQYEIQGNVLYSKINPIDPSDEDIQEYSVELIGHIQNLDHKAVLIVDTSQAKILKAEHRVAIGNILKHNKNLLVKKLHALVYIVSHPILQFVLNGIFLVSGPPVKYHVTTSIDRANKWIESRFGVLKTE